jgi:hypothetical protein
LIAGDADRDLTLERRVPDFRAAIIKGRQWPASA